MDSTLASRIGMVKDRIRISDIWTVSLDSKGNGTTNCPRCIAEGRSGLHKLSIWGNRDAKCWSSRCSWKKVDVIDIYRLLHHLDNPGGFSKALRSLEEQAGIPTESASVESPPNVLEEALDIYQDILWSARGSKARAYLLSRGWNEQLLREIGIGYAPHSRSLRDYGMSSQCLRDRELLDDRDREHLSSRVIFPIRDIRGRLVHLSGRYLGPMPLDEHGEPRVPKYKHTKGGMRSYLILEDKIPKYKTRSNWVCLSEGYPDTLSLYGMGIAAVGTSGLGGITQHIHKLSEFESLIAIYDVDVHSSDHPLLAGEYKSWSQVLPQLIDLQCLMPNTRIYLWFLDRCNTNAKDVNDYICSSGIDRATLKASIWTQKVDLVEYLCQRWGQDLSRHGQLLKLCSSTGRGKELLAQVVPNGLSPVEYAMGVLGA